MEKAALYLRSSKDRSDVSIDAQRRQLEELAKERNLLITQEYVDAVESGMDVDRPAFQKCIHDLKSSIRTWKSIIILDTSRIARRRHLALMFERECEKAGVRLIYKSLPDSDPISEMLLKSILQAMDEWHSLTSKAKGLAGMAENVKQGWRAGGRAPRGYKLEHIATGSIREGMPVTKSRLIKGDDAEIVSLYLKSRAAGLSRLRASEASGFIAAETSKLDIERNSLVYAGHTTWNRHNEQSNDGGYVGGTKYRPRNEWVINRNTHDPLISDDEAEIILTAVGATNQRKSRAKRVYLLSGLLVDEMGAIWHSDGDGSYRVGKGPRIKAESVESVVIEKVIADLSADEMSTSILDHYKEVANKKGDVNVSKRLRSKVTELKSNISKLVSLLTQTTSPDALLRSIETLEKEQVSATLQLEEYLEFEKSAKVMKALSITDVKRMLSNIVEDVRNEKNQEIIKDILATFIQSIVLDATTFNASMTYKISHTGDKVASPRGFEPRSPP